MVAWADYTTGIADIVGSFQDDGEVRVNLGNAADGVGFASEEPMYGPDGFIGMPNEPSDDGACQAIYLVDGDRKRVVGTRDNRWLDKVGALKPGDRAIITDSPARILLKRDGDKVVLYTETSSEKTMMLVLDGSGDQIMAVCGDNYMRLTVDAFEVNVGGNLLRIDAETIKVIGKTFAAATGMVLLGAPIVPGVTTTQPAAFVQMGVPLPSTAVFIAK